MPSIVFDAENNTIIIENDILNEWAIGLECVFKLNVKSVGDFWIWR